MSPQRIDLTFAVSAQPGYASKETFPLKDLLVEQKSLIIIVESNCVVKLN